MSETFKLPDLGEGVKEGQVLRLLVSEGDTVVEDQPLMEVETDKAAVEIPSPHAGLIAQIHVKESQVVNVGDPMVTFGDAAAGAERPAAAQAKSVAAGSSSEDSGGGTAVAAPPTSPPRPSGRRKPASPAVRKLAKKLNIDLERIDGSGPGGRILRKDVEAAAEGGGSATDRPATTGVGAAGEPAANITPSPPAPAVPPPSAPPSPAPSVRAAPAQAPVAAPAAVTSDVWAELQGEDAQDDFGPVRRSPITQTRKAIASIMTHSASLIPHVTDCDDADVTELDQLRRQFNERAGVKIGMLPFIIRAVVRALQRHPIINASFDEGRGEIVYKRYYHIAVGVQTERGLVAPVLRNADRMGVQQINDELNGLIDRVRSGRFTLEDGRGGTYTISNAGAMGGSRYSTPIITHPQVAVLAAGRSRMQPWVVNGEVVPRLILPLSHSMDHRIIDGAQEMAFLKDVISDLEQPIRLSM